MTSNNLEQHFRWNMIAKSSLRQITIVLGSFNGRYTVNIFRENCSGNRVNCGALSTLCWVAAAYRLWVTSCADQFHRYFGEKVAGVRSATADAPPPSFLSTSRDTSLCQFQLVTVDDVVAAVRALPDKSCALDPLPTIHLKAVVDVIAPFLTDLIIQQISVDWFCPGSF